VHYATPTSPPSWPRRCADVEAFARGVTVYLPTVGAAVSTVVERRRRSLLGSSVWRRCDLDLDPGASAGHPVSALVRSRGVRRSTAGPGDTHLPLRRSRRATSARSCSNERERRGQHRRTDPRGGEEHRWSYSLEVERSLPIERWNAQISLLTDEAARIMAEAVAHAPTLDPAVVERLRRIATALGFPGRRDVVRRCRARWRPRRARATSCCRRCMPCGCGMLSSLRATRY
jgi:hypothetical protein